jgi:general secretion pathway protein B
MSYILEALNKSEQERRGSKTPDINTIHRPPPGKPAGLIPWLGIVLVFGLLNGAALTYWFWSNQESETTPLTNSSDKPAEMTPSSLSPSNPTGTSELTTNQYTKPVAPTESEFEFQPTIITPQTILKPSTEAVRITELPINVQRQIPNLVFSSHLYSDDGEFRMVNINGKMIREGDLVANDLTLREITEEGVVLSYLHYVFEVSVLRDWSFN